MSFGITALNELEQIWHQKSLVEDGSFALEVMQYINKKVGEFKKQDNILWLSMFCGLTRSIVCKFGIVNSYFAKKSTNCRILYCTVI